MLERGERSRLLHLNSCNEKHKFDHLAQSFYAFILCLTFVARIMNQTGLTCILTLHFFHSLGRQNANSVVRK